MHVKLGQYLLNPYNVDPVPPAGLGCGGPGEGGGPAAASRADLGPLGAPPGRPAPVDRLEVGGPRRCPHTHHCRLQQRLARVERGCQDALHQDIGNRSAFFTIALFF